MSQASSKVKSELRSARSVESRSADMALDRPTLKKRQVEFLEVFDACSFMPIKDICAQVRMRKATFDRWMEEDPEFRKAIQRHHNQVLRATNMSRKQVMKGMLEAIDVAKDQRHANAMISGWKEIGRMCGFYEPERREIHVSMDNKEMMKEIKAMSREELMRLAHEQDAIDAEFTEIDSTQDPETP